MVGLEHFLILSGVLFCLGLYGALSKRNVITVMMCIELMFTATTIAVVAFSRYVAPAALAQAPAFATEETLQGLLTGQVFAVFIITVAAAEVALGLGIIMAVYRRKASVDVSDVNLLRR